jgi:hypothetical protein
MLLLWLLAVAEVDGAGLVQTMRLATMAALVALLAYWVWERLRSD